jgi:hypothetical protein
MFDMSRLMAEHLAEAERHVRDAHERVRRLEMSVLRLRWHGFGTEAGETLLHQMYNAPTDFHRHLHWCRGGLRWVQVRADPLPSRSFILVAEEHPDAKRLRLLLPSTAVKDFSAVGSERPRDAISCHPPRPEARHRPGLRLAHENVAAPVLG